MLECISIKYLDCITSANNLHYKVQGKSDVLNFTIFITKVVKT